MILVVPSAVITLMYFMFPTFPDRRRGTVTVQHRLPDPAGTVPAVRDVPDHLDHHATRTGIGDARAHPDHSAAPPRSPRRLRGAFSIAAAAQAILACIVCFWLLGFETKGSPVWVFLIAVINAVLGVGLGLLASAFARTEFQAVQFMPVFIVPAAAAGGHHRPRAAMPTWLGGSATRCRPATRSKRCNRSVPTPI